MRMNVKLRGLCRKRGGLDKGRRGAKRPSQHNPSHYIGVFSSKQWSTLSEHGRVNSGERHSSLTYSCYRRMKFLTKDAWWDPLGPQH
jgi:hypothetical protein